ncbi:MAG TPA: TerB family tellurite resistance protein [Polyangiaceae bacterium]
MFGRWLTPSAPLPTPTGAEELEKLVRGALGQKEDDSVLVVVALAGLLGAVAYADRSYTESEEAQVRAELARVHGMPPAAVDVVCAALRRHIVQISSVEVPRYCRVLRELGDRELRTEVLEVLVDLAAVDGVITTAETNLLRQVTTALGLSQSDYNDAQARHRERLSALKPQA